MSMRTDEIAIVQLGPDDLGEAVEVLTAAFLADPLMHYLSQPSSASHEECVRALMTYAAGYRVALHWPLLGIRDADGRIAAVVGISLPGGAPLTPVVQQFDDTYRATVGPRSSERYDEYERVATTNEPSARHHYLGVLGARPDCQGRGLGTALLVAARDLAERDPTSSGIWLDTATPLNVRIYESAGYEVRATSPLGGIIIWGLFQPKASRP